MSMTTCKPGRKRLPEDNRNPPSDGVRRRYPVRLYSLVNWATGDSLPILEEWIQETTATLDEMRANVAAGRWIPRDAYTRCLVSRRPRKASPPTFIQRISNEATRRQQRRERWHQQLREWGAEL